MSPDVYLSRSQPDDGGRGGAQNDREQSARQQVAESRSTAPPASRDLPGGERRGTTLAQITADRPIFTLSVAADLLGLHPRTLRIYEEKKLVVPARTQGNRRRYSQNDIERFRFIRQLTRGGVNLEGVRIILDMADELRRLGGDPESIIERNLQAFAGQAGQD